MGKIIKYLTKNINFHKKKNALQYILLIVYFTILAQNKNCFILCFKHGKTPEGTDLAT